MSNQITIAQTAGSQKIEIPMDIFAKERLMKYHGVDNDKDLKLAIYREMLKKARYKRSSQK